MMIKFFLNNFDPLGILFSLVFAWMLTKHFEQKWHNRDVNNDFLTSFADLSILINNTSKKLNKTFEEGKAFNPANEQEAERDAQKLEEIMKSKGFNIKNELVELHLRVQAILLSTTFTELTSKSAKKIYIDLANFHQTSIDGERSTKAHKDYQALVEDMYIIINQHIEEIPKNKISK